MKLIFNPCYDSKVYVNLEKDKEEYVGKYAVQLAAYEDALRAAETSVKDKLVYYSVLGYLISL